MRNGATPADGAKSAIQRIIPLYPEFQGAVIAADKTGRYGAACHGFPRFTYSIYNNEQDTVQIVGVDCI